MSTVHDAVRERHGTHGEGFRREGIKEFGDEADRDDVGGAAHFMKMHGVGRGVVYRRLRRGEH